MGRVVVGWRSPSSSLLDGDRDLARGRLCFPKINRVPCAVANTFSRYETCSIPDPAAAHQQLFRDERVESNGGLTTMVRASAHLRQLTPLPG